MKILLASSNTHKIKELKNALPHFEVCAFNELFKPLKIKETGQSFKENALIKSKAVFDFLKQEQKQEFIVLSDDSGLCVEALDNAPGIYSARFSQQGDDENNRKKLLFELEKLQLQKSKAYYVACIALSCVFGHFSLHGFMYGTIINEERGKNGFGYDSLFIPQGFDKSLGELDEGIKAQISHRAKALKLAQIILKTFKINGENNESLY